jgi:hypothetical protein
MAAAISTHAASGSLQGLVDTVLHEGSSSRLPPHLSVVLGISKEERETAVKQAVVRDGQTVKTFNVCTSKTSDVVIMSYNEQDRSTTAYLTSAAGALRKAVSYRAGAPAEDHPLRETRGDFAKEIKFWIDVERRQVGSRGALPH